MVTLVFATLMEAAHTLEKTKAQSYGGLDYFFECENSLRILISGMGEEQTRERLLAHIDEIEEIVNIGIAGALKSTLILHTIYSVHSVDCERSLPSLVLNPDSIHPKGLALYTVQTPLHDPLTRDKLALNYDIVDMEGYTIAEIAKKAGKKCTLIKMISDVCDEKTSHTIRDHLPFYSKELWHYVNATMSDMMNVTKTGVFT
jgi:adenosylhomocysteine nucleosidase